MALAVPAAASSPSPLAPTSAPPPSPGTDASPTGLGWLPVSLAIPDEHWLTGLTPWAGGFSALESDDDDYLFALWTSPDGEEWARAALPEGVESGRLVALGDHLYLQESRGRGDSQELRIRTWRTGDGREWQRQGLFEWHLPESVGDEWRIVTPFLVAAPDRLVMVGEVVPCCGTGGNVPVAWRVASLAAAAAPEVPLGGAVIWTSPDGAEWTRQSTRDLQDPSWPDYGWIEDVAGVPDGVLMARASADGELFTSPDGSAWESMGPLPPGYTDLGSGLVPADDRVVVSFEARDPNGSKALEVWLRATDGTWVRSLREPLTAGDALVATGSLVVLAATGYDAGADTWPRLFVSTEGGATWDPGLSWSGPRGSCARDLATDGARLVLFGCDEGAPTLWHADVPGSPATATWGDSR